MAGHPGLHIRPVVGVNQRSKVLDVGDGFSGAQSEENRDVIVADRHVIHDVPRPRPDAAAAQGETQAIVNVAK